MFYIIFSDSGWNQSLMPASEGMTGWILQILLCCSYMSWDIILLLNCWTVNLFVDFRPAPVKKSLGGCEGWNSKRPKGCIVYICKQCTPRWEDLIIALWSGSTLFNILHYSWTYRTFSLKQPCVLPRKIYDKNQDR